MAARVSSTMEILELCKSIQTLRDLGIDLRKVTGTQSQSKVSRGNQNDGTNHCAMEQTGLISDLLHVVGALNPKLISGAAEWGSGKDSETGATQKVAFNPNCAEKESGLSAGAANNNLVEQVGLGKEAMKSIYTGDTSKQLKFLSDIANQASISPLQQDNDTNHRSIDSGSRQEPIDVEGSNAKEQVSPISSPKKASRSFKEALVEGKSIGIDGEEDSSDLKQPSLPRFEGGNLVVDLDEEEYNKGIEELQYSVVGRLFLARGVHPPTTMELKAKLASFWKIDGFKIVPMGGGLHHVILNSMQAQSTVMAYGPVNVSPGTFRVARWQPGFDPGCLRTTTQVWVKFYGIPLEFIKSQNLFNIAAAVGTPLRIDQATLNLYQGLYARVLVDIDISKKLPERVLASLKGKNISFFVTMIYEQLPKFCNICRAIGHNEVDCKKVIGGGNNYNQRRDPIHFRRRIVDERRSEMGEKRINDIRKEDDFLMQQERGSKEATQKEGTDREIGSSTSQPHLAQAELGEMSNREQQLITQVESEREVEVLHGGTVQQGVQSQVLRNDQNVQAQLAAQAMHAVSDASGRRITAENTVVAETQENDSILDNDFSQTPCRDMQDPDGFITVRHRNHIPKKHNATVSSTIQLALNNFEGLRECDNEETWVPRDTDYYIQKGIEVENLRKQKEWECTKKRLEDRMQADLVMRRNQRMQESGGKGTSVSSTPPPPPPPPPLAKRRFKVVEEKQEEKDFDQITNSGVPETQELEEEAHIGDPEKIYWDEVNEIYFHISGMCYDPDPGAKAYYTLIDQQGGDLRPLYYVQSGGDFVLAKNGKLGQCNKVVLDDKSWDRNAIYSVKSPKYRQGLPKMFKEKMKERNK